MPGYIVVGGPSRDGETFNKGLTFVSPHLFPTETAAKRWTKKLRSQNSNMEFLVFDVSGHHLPKGVFGSDKARA
jgi:hypothetical protein